MWGLTKVFEFHINHLLLAFETRQSMNPNLPKFDHPD